MSQSQRSYPGFDGKVDPDLSKSSPSWATKVQAPRNAPNVVLVLCDDMGFADLGCYGSEIATPNIDCLASGGVRFVNYHVTPLCSPTRAALLTGINHHRAGMGYVSVEDHGFPGYRAQLVPTVGTAAEIFRHNGYATFAIGKWHLSPHSAMSDSGDKRSWPLQRGFDRYYGFLEAMTNFHQPHYLYEDNHVLTIDEYPKDYYLTDDLTNQALRMVRNLRASDPEKPFFLYFAHGAVHGPHHAKAGDIAKYRGRYDAGWDIVREQRYRRQLELGVIRPGTELAPRNRESGFEVEPWEKLTKMRKELNARYMEVYAAMVDSVDQNLGRLLDGIGDLDNTVVIFASDNGASEGGGSMGTSQYYGTRGGSMQNTTHDTPMDEDYQRLNVMGGPTTFPHYSLGWAMTSNCPFRFYKKSMFAGGNQVPLIMAWPKRIPDRGAIRPQYAYVTDILPTLVEMLNLSLPAERQGQPVQPMTGISMLETIKSPTVSSPHSEQYYEMRGQRGYHRGEWELLTLHRNGEPFDDKEWQLFHVAKDPTQLTDLASANPQKVEELSRAWNEAAWNNFVYPLGDTKNGLSSLKPPDVGTRNEPIVLTPAHDTLEPWIARGLTYGRSFTIKILADLRRGDRGVLVAHGDQAGGYLVFVEEAELRFCLNTFGSTKVFTAKHLDEGSREITLKVDAPGSNIWNLTLLVDGGSRLQLNGLAMWNTHTPFEGIDVGLDRRSPVCWDLYEKYGSFPFTGTIHSVTYTPGKMAPDSVRALVRARQEDDLKYQ